MGASTERLALVIDRQATGTGIRDTVAEIGQLGTAAKVQAASVNQAGRLAMDMAHNQASAADKARVAAATAAQARQAELALERQGISESLQLIQLRARTVNVANAEEVNEIRQIILAERQHLQAIGATEKEYLRLQLVLQGVESRVQSYGQSIARAQAQGTRLNSVTGAMPVDRIRTGANALSSVAFAAQNATLGGQGAVVAFGNLAQTLALVGTAGRFAAMASGIGAAVVVATALLTILNKMSAAAELTADQMRSIRKLSLQELDAELARLEKRRAEITAGVVAAITGRGPQLGNVRKEISEIEGRIKALREQRPVAVDESADRAKRLLETRRQLTATAAEDVARGRESLALTGRQLAAEQDRRVTIGETFKIKELEADQALAARQREIAAQFELRDQEGAIIPLTREQVALRDQLVAQAKQQRDYSVQQASNEALISTELQKQAQERFRRETARSSGDLVAEFRARMEEIEEERRAAVAKGEATEVDAEARKQQKIRQLRRETLVSTITAEKQIADALINSGNRTIRAIGLAADVIRRIKIGALAAEAAVQSAMEFGRVPGALALGNVAGAALHAASGTQLAAAAALGFRESLGGGGSGGGSGGGGGSNASTFEPVPRAGDGGVTINLITRDPYGREAISQTMYELDRARVLKRPIPINPTPGLVARAG